MIVGHVPHEVSTRHGGSIIWATEDWARLLGLTMQQFGRGQHLQGIGAYKWCAPNNARVR